MNPTDLDSTGTDEGYQMPICVPLPAFGVEFIA